MESTQQASQVNATPAADSAGKSKRKRWLRGKKNRRGENAGADNGGSFKDSRVNWDEVLKVHTTVLTKQMALGDDLLGKAFFNSWKNMHHGLHYITSLSTKTVKGPVSRAANRGLEEYLKQKREETDAMLKGAQELADSNGMEIGQYGTIREMAVEVACPMDTDVMDIVRMLDHYLLVMDSLWIGKAIDVATKDNAHDEAVQIVQGINRLATRMRVKMARYKRAVLEDSLERSEDSYRRDMELLVMDLTGIDLRKMDAEAPGASAEPAGPGSTAESTPKPRAQNKPSALPAEEKETASAKKTKAAKGNGEDTAPAAPRPLEAEPVSRLAA